MPEISKRATDAELWGRLLSTQQIVSKELTDALERNAGIPLVWYEVLLILAKSPGGKLRLREIERMMFHSQSGLTRLIDRIQVAGHLVKEKATEDGRGIYARLTPEGMHIFRRAASTYVDGIHKNFLHHMDEEERAVVARVFERVRESLLDEGEDNLSSIQKLRPPE